MDPSLIYKGDRPNRQEKGSAHRTRRYSACCVRPYSIPCSKDPFSQSCVSVLKSSTQFFKTIGSKYRNAESLYRPPSQGLAYELGDEQEVIRYFVRGFVVGFDPETVVEVVAIDLHGVVGIDFRGDHLCFFQIAEPGPAALSVPVLASFSPLSNLISTSTGITKSSLRWTLRRTGRGCYFRFFFASFLSFFSRYHSAGKESTLRIS